MNIAKIHKIELNKKTAYLAGVIIGDGHISSSLKSKKDKSFDHKISIDSADKEYLVLISKIIKSIIKTKSAPKQHQNRKNEKERLFFQVRNKSLHYFLNKKLGIPKGKKSFIVRVPEKIKNSESNMKKAFIAGLFDTDGGIRGHTIGFTSASENLITDVGLLLEEFKIEHLEEQWFNKKYQKSYYGIRLYKEEIDRFLKHFPLQNREKLVRIQTKLKCGDTKVVKWARFRKD